MSVLDRAIKALQERHDEWIITTIDGRSWFSDGRAAFLCEGREENTNHCYYKPEKWKSGLSAVVKKAEEREGYRLAASDGMVGGFKQGYYRRIAPSEGRVLYLNERYVRAVGDAELWVHESDPAKHVIAVRDGAVVGIIMPMKNGTGLLELNLDSMPPIPFVDDEALYHECEAD